MKKRWLDTSYAFAEILAERKRKKVLVSFGKMRDRPIDVGQKLKKKGTKTGTVCVG